MHPVGQLGITALNTIGDPNKTVSGKKPKTVCLYDGQEIRTKGDGDYEADAAALRQAAATYASNGSWMIDISNPNWQHQLEQIRDAEERNGGGIDRIMIFDHGDSSGQEFGSTRLDPYSTEWQTITSCIRTGGHIVLTGCNVATHDKDGNGREYLYQLYRNSNGKRRPKIDAYDGKVRHRENKLQHSVTPGEEHTIPLD
ncbi:MAG: hypothetical protein B7Z37_29840 [Verrucomicrobia bacterium 12-59-8]|nr:MAG: hypothetical protein B7Z37_29840 [Verrucomicrobia bacterium 12-59-8]